ncbi:MAG: DUF1622 domain-containing protein [bacterium]|nr:DUF1622 domain-containing protein [bacterium]
MEKLIHDIALYVSYFAEFAAAIIIVSGSVQAIWIYLKALIFSQSNFTKINAGRLKLGYSLSLGLGFLVGADIIKTAAMPSWTEIGHLGAIVTIRIILNYFLMRDMKEHEAKVAATKTVS